MKNEPDPPSSDSLETLRSAAGIGSKRPDRAGYGVSETAIIRMRRQDSARRVGVGTLLGVVLLLAAVAGAWWWWAPSGSEHEVVPATPAVTEDAGAAEEPSAEELPAEPVAEEAVEEVAPILRQMTAQELVALREQVTERILGWAEAWSTQNVDRYLSFYSEDFVPESGAERESWEASRRREVNQPEWLRVSLVGLEVASDGDDDARATFTQTLRVEGREDVVRKELHLRRGDEDWMIVGERVLERLPGR